MGAYNRDPIGWEYEIKQFFHEQGHELKDKMLRGKAATACPKDLERLRHNQQNYVDVRVSKDMYELNHELRTFAPLGLSYFCASFFCNYERAVNETFQKERFQNCPLLFR